MCVADNAASAIKRVRITGSDIASAGAIENPAHARTDRSRRFAVIGAAILEKMCRHAGMSVVSRRTTPYVISTPRGNIAVSVMVSAIRGDAASKHVIIPCTSLRSPRGVVDHVVVAAFVGKGADENMSAGVETRLAGWIPIGDVRALSDGGGRIASRLSVMTIPVRKLRAVDELRKYVYGENNDSKEDSR